MKILRSIILAVALLFSVSAHAADPAPAAAASTKLPPAVIAVVNVQQILKESLAGKSVRDQLSSRREAYQREVTEEEKKLRAAEQELAKQRATLTEEQFAQKRREFEENVRKVQSGVQERARALDTAFNEALGTIRQNLGMVVAEAATEKGATVVLDRDQVIVVESSFDITDTVMERLNRKLPKVTVNVPAAARAAR